jgi:hypothetical protein
MMILFVRKGKINRRVRSVKLKHSKVAACGNVAALY